MKQATIRMSKQLCESTQKLHTVTVCTLYMKMLEDTLNENVMLHALEKWELRTK
jgi:hypothetical protein